MGMIEKTIEISAAHWLPFHNGLCKNLHGHNYKFDVAVGGRVSDSSHFILDFGDLKKIMNETIGKWDHALLTHLTEEEVVGLKMFGGNESLFRSIGIIDPSRVIPLGVWTTAENLSRIACKKIAYHPIIDAAHNILMVRVRCWETSTSFAECRLDRSLGEWFEHVS